MRSAPVVATILAVHLAAAIGATSPDEQVTPPGPLVLLYERDPWLMVIGSDSPVFALYDNGLVIYSTGDREPEKRFMAKVLTKSERDALVAGLPLAKLFPGLNRKMINAASATDQPTNELYVFRGDEPEAVAVYGSLRGESPDRAQAPAAFVEAFDLLTSFRAENASPWLPEFIEVLFWPYEYSPEKPLPWPERWPALDDVRTLQRGEGSFSVFLPASELKAFLQLAKSLGERQAMLIGGRKCAVSYRMPFPAE